MKQQVSFSDTFLHILRSSWQCPQHCTNRTCEPHTVYSSWPDRDICPNMLHSDAQSNITHREKQAHYLPAPFYTGLVISKRKPNLNLQKQPVLLWSRPKSLHTAVRPGLKTFLECLFILRPFLGLSKASRYHQDFTLVQSSVVESLNQDQHS